MPSVKQILTGVAVIIVTLSLGYSVYSFVSLREARAVAELRQARIDSLHEANARWKDSVAALDSTFADSMAVERERREEAEETGVEAELRFTNLRERVRGMVSDTANAIIDSMEVEHDRALSNKDIIIASLARDTIRYKLRLAARDVLIQGQQEEIVELNKQVTDLKRLNQKDFLDYSLDVAEKAAAGYGVFKFIEGLLDDEDK